MSYRKRLRIVDIVPPLEREEVYEQDICYVAISLNNVFFSGYKIDLLLSWLSKRFGQCHLIIADYLYRHNVHMQMGLQGKEAVEFAKSMGNKINEDLDDYLPHYPNIFKVSRWKDWYSHERFSINEANLWTLYQTNHDFMTGVNTTAVDYLDRLLARGQTIAVSRDQALTLSQSFILEECAVYSVLGDLGIHVDVYPGTYPPVINDVAFGVFPDAPIGLQNRINVNLKTVRK